MSWTHLGDTTPRARRQYLCGLCGLRIRKGARYIARRGIDGDLGPTTVKMHAVCESKTRNWELWQWECHGTVEFREEELGLPLLRTE